MADLPLDADQVAAVTALARRAGAAIVAIYGGADWQLSRKSDDSPITAADLAAHHIIVDGLAAQFPGWPVLSEESAAVCDSERRSWSRYWLVDPLDGTKEFLAKSGQFTVNIALIEEGEAVFGAVYLPVGDELYWGGPGTGSWSSIAGQQRQLQCRAAPLSSAAGPLRVTASSRHSASAAARIGAALSVPFGAVEQIALGSSLKLCRIASGELDCYPRYGRTGEWDTAAGHAILRGAGGDVIASSGERLRYSKPTPYNSSFVAVGDPSLAWWSWLPAPLRKGQITG